MRKSRDFFAFHCITVVMDRYQKAAIIADLQKKMVLLAGPRQSGKTTLAKEIGRGFHSTTYLTSARF